MPTFGPREDGDAIRMVRLGVAKGGRNLSSSGRPDQRSDLSVDVDSCEAGSRKGMVEMDSSVVGAAACSKQAPLPRAESNCFNSRTVKPFVLLAPLADEKRSVLTRDHSGTLDMYAIS